MECRLGLVVSICIDRHLVIYGIYGTHMGCEIALVPGLKQLMTTLFLI